MRLNTVSWCTRASFKHKHSQSVVRSTCQLLQLSLALTQSQHNKQRRRLERSSSDADWAEAGTHCRRFTRSGSVFKHGGCDCIRPQLTLHSQNSPLTRGNQARAGIHTICGAIKGTDLLELGPVQTEHFLCCFFFIVFVCKCPRQRSLAVAPWVLSLSHVWA